VSLGPAGAVGAARLVTRRPSRWREESRFAWLTLAPALGFFALFVGFPVVYAFYLSFH
jgi:ABC-type sugar transport system permease subunit